MIGMKNDQQIEKKYRKEHASQPLSHLLLVKRLLAYIAPYSSYAALSLLLLLIARTVDVVVPIYVGYVVQQMTDGLSMNNSAKEALLTTIQGEGAIIATLLVVGYLVDLASMTLKNRIGQRAIYTLRTDLYNHIQHLPVDRFDHYPIGRLMTRTIHDVEQINQMFTESVIPLLGSILLFIGMIVGMAWLNWKIAITFYLIIPFVAFLTLSFQHYQRFCYEIIRNISSAMNGFFQEYLSGFSTIRAFGLEKKEKRRFDELNEDNREANMLASHHFSFFIAGIDLLQSFSLIAIFAIIIFFLPTGGNFDAGTFFTFTLYATMFFRPLIDLADRYNILQSAIAAADRVFTTLDKPIETDLRSSSNAKIDQIESISFENVWFAYEPDLWIFKDLSFEIKRGESVALVGTTGAGKSTIINLLMRFYEFQKGSIKINGHDIREIPLKELRGLFSVVMQDPVIFSGTIGENISLYDPNISRDEMLRVIEELNLESFLHAFPEGLSHSLRERGETLSMGERQLISLARSVAHKRSMMMFDEATANIDTTTEKMIQNALKKILTAQTALIIAHRLSTIKDVDKIMVLHQGKIAETGTHHELIELQGLYEKFYRFQFNGNSSRV